MIYVAFYNILVNIIYWCIKLYFDLCVAVYYISSGWKLPYKWHKQTKVYLFERVSHLEVHYSLLIRGV